MMRIFTLALCCLLVTTALTTDAVAIAPVPPPSPKAVKVSQAVLRLGAGGDSLVAVRLRDNTIVKGRLASVARDSFVVTDLATGEDQQVFYSAVDRLRGVNIGSGAQVQVGVGFKAKLARVVGFVLPLGRVQKNSLTSGEKTLLIGIGVGILIAIVLAKAL